MTIGYSDRGVINEVIPIKDISPLILLESKTTEAYDRITEEGMTDE